MPLWLLVTYTSRMYFVSRPITSPCFNSELITVYPPRLRRESSDVEMFPHESNSQHHFERVLSWGFRETHGAGLATGCGSDRRRTG